MIHPLVKQLHSARKRLGWTLTMVEDKIGYPEKAIRTWEKGQYTPRLRSFIDYANVLGFDVVLKRRDE